MSDLFFYFLPFIVGGAISGIVCGLFPFFLAIKRRRPWLGFIALNICVACGIGLGAILAFPIATSFAAAILLTQPREPKRKRVRIPATADVQEVESLT
ncbi:MAG: hypothetical protein AAF635_10635 [Cyanobacteria bacterium P01_C01_bin.69]